MIIETFRTAQTSELLIFKIVKRIFTIINLTSSYKHFSMNMNIFGKEKEFLFKTIK